jgi:hypothetical protein
MKTGDTARKGLLVGAWAGLVLFAIIGLLPGSLVGGVIGLNIAGSLFGLPLESAILPRVIVALSMLFWILVSGITFVVGSSTVGWLVGYVVEAVRAANALDSTNRHKAKRVV